MAESASRKVYINASDENVPSHVTKCTFCTYFYVADVIFCVFIDLIALLFSTIFTKFAEAKRLMVCLITVNMQRLCVYVCGTQCRGFLFSMPKKPTESKESVRCVRAPGRLLASSDEVTAQEWDKLLSKSRY